ncbi:MAG: amidohydrolase family protein [Gemmataceae bacterium]|nr:amidohydrolase family protein [Gemmataceae bacterium]
MIGLTLTADRLFDGTGAAAVLNPVLRLVGDRVEAIDRSLLPPANCSGERLDFSGCTILPGLIDTHVHLVMVALETNEAIVEQVGRESDDDLTRRALANARAALHAGLTTVRDCGGRGRIVQAVRDRIRRGEADGPDVLSCGAPITTRTGHCHWLGLLADTPAEVRAAAERMLAEEADFLKVMATGGNMTPSSDPMRAQYDPDTLTLIADIGRKAGRHTAAHVLSRAALPGAVAARVRTIEHCDWRVEENRYEFDPELARRMRDQGQYVGLTMSGTARRAFLPQIASLNSGPVRRLDIRFACERQMIDSGVPFTLHSDAGVRLTPIDRFDIGLRAAVRELRLTPAEALRAATGTAAEALGLDDRGTLTPGRRADLVVVRGNPLADLECLHNVVAVMKAGRWVLPQGPPSEAAASGAA